MSISRDARTMAYREVQARTMGDVVVMDLATRKTERLTTVNPELKHLALGTLKAVSWKSFDGMEIWGLLLTPPGDDGTSRLPLLVYCHGGPIGGVTLGLFPQFMHVPGQIDPYPTEAFASAAGVDHVMITVLSREMQQVLVREAQSYSLFGKVILGKKDTPAEYGAALKKLNFRLLYVDGYTGRTLWKTKVKFKGGFRGFDNMNAVVAKKFHKRFPFRRD